MARTTNGRYYFCDPKTPFYRGLHRVSSRNWNDQNFEHVQTLGESLTAPQEWDDGNGDFLTPIPQIVGNADCLANGDVIREGRLATSYREGFPLNCFTLSELNQMAIAKSQAIRICSTQYAYARLIALLYDDEHTRITEFFQAWLGNDWTVDFYQPASPLPQVAVARNAVACVILIEGTTDFQQFALQAFYSLIAPAHVGIFRTSEFWYSASTYALQCMANSGITFAMPRTIVGHSYGAVTACLLGARLRHHTPSTAQRVLMFASPRPGDIAAPALLRSDYINIVNRGDVVPLTPFNGDELSPIVGTIPSGVLAAWLQWRVMTQTALLETDGQLREWDYPATGTADIASLTANAILGIPLAPQVAHTIAEYASRTKLRCPFPVWPLTPALYLLLT